MIMIKYTLAIKESESARMEVRMRHYMLADRPAAGLVVISLMTEKTYKIGRE